MAMAAPPSPESVMYSSPGTYPHGIASDGTNLWAVSRTTGKISCVDPIAGIVLQQFASPASSPRGLEYRNGKLWHVDSYQDRIYEVWTSETIGGTPVCQCADIAATPPLNTYVTAMPAAQQFYRIHVEVAP